MSIYRGRNRRDFYLSSLLYDSIDDRNLSAVKSLLCDKQADPNLVLPKKGISPFHLIIGCDSNEFAINVTRLILQYGGNPNVSSDDGLTPLHIAAAWKRLEILQLLLNCGGNPEARDANMMTPIHYAKKEDFTEGLQLLKSHVSIKNDAIKQENEDCCNFILDKILIDNGYEVGEYKIVNKCETDSIKNKPMEKLNNLPQADTNEYVMNWFSKNVNDVGGETYIKLPRSTGSSSESEDFLSFESSIDESDNENAKLEKILDITFRKSYKKKKVSDEKKTISKPQVNGEVDFSNIYSNRDDEINSSKDRSLEESSKFVEYSSESGILTLPNSKELPFDNKVFKEETNQNLYKQTICLKENFKSDLSLGYMSYKDEKHHLSISKEHGVSENVISTSDAQKNQDNPDICSKEQKDFSLDKNLENIGYLKISEALSKNSTTEFKQYTDSNYMSCMVNSQFEKNIFEISADESKANSALQSEGIGSTDLSFVSVSEIYKYEDKAEGIILYERRLLKVSSECNGSLQTGSVSSKMSSLPELFDYDVETLRKELTLLGFQPGPITTTTKRVYLKKLHQLKKRPVIIKHEEKPSAEKVYSVELQKTLGDKSWTNNLQVYKTLEETLLKEFCTPDLSRKWREGINKTSFTYLLLDPRVTNNLPCRADLIEPKQIWETFLTAIFYVGKGKRSRPYSHLYEAVGLWKNGIFTSNNRKLQNILNIWKDNGGVICLHVFQNIIPVEAYTREAAMINALKIDNLTNVKTGDFYGIAATWPQKQKKMLGVYLLYKAMNIFLHEGERQLYPTDIN